MRTALNVELGVEALLGQAPRAMRGAWDDAAGLPAELRQALSGAR